MSTTTPDSGPLATRNNSDEIKTSLAKLEELLESAARSRFDEAVVACLGDALRSLHARIRVRHAIGYIDESQVAELIPPELADERARLLAEHPTIIGLLDRLIRVVDSIADRSAEETEVFILRGLELLAVLRRHEAEEDCLFFLAFWRDTGGESGS